MRGEEGGSKRKSRSLEKCSTKRVRKNRPAPGLSSNADSKSARTEPKKGSIANIKSSRKNVTLVMARSVLG